MLAYKFLRKKDEITITCAYGHKTGISFGVEDLLAGQLRLHKHVIEILIRLSQPQLASLLFVYSKTNQEKTKSLMGDKDVEKNFKKFISE